jgi:ATP-binding cassette subfamily B protein
MVAGNGEEPRLSADRLLVRAGLRGGVWVGALALAALAIAGAELALPALLGRAVDDVVSDGATGPWVAWCAVLVVVLVAADALDDLAGGAAIARSTAWLRHTALRHVLDVGPAGAGRFNPGEVSTRLVGNAADAGRLAPDVVRAGASAILGVGGTVALALIDPWLCLTFLSGLPVLLVLVRAFARDASAVAALYLKVQGAIAGRLVEAVAGARTIAAAGTVDHEVERVLGPLPDLRRHGMAMWRTQMRITAQDALVVSLLEIAVLAVAGVLLAGGRITPGELLAASGYVLIAASLGSVVNAVTRLARARAAAERLVEMLAQPPVPNGSGDLPPGRGRLELRGVTVRSGGRPVLDGLDLVVPAGALVAVVGSTGAGKSLLAALAGRLLDPDEGEVLLDGVPLTELSSRELRRAVGYGFERPALFGRTVGDAIAFGADAPPAEAVVAAARAARADDFIRRLPDAYGTPLGQAPMSGGERQRIGLARTFAHAGRVVVLDDVAASLDTVTEHHIGRVLTGALSDRTRILVAHRASTAARADAVVWLDGGRLRTMAPHAALWHDPQYRALFGAEGR